MMARFIEAGFDPKELPHRQIYGDVRPRARLSAASRPAFRRHGDLFGRLDGVVPLEPASMENRNIIQWDKDDCERLGIVKVDLLGLGMMAVIRDTLTLIEEHRGEKVDLGKISKKDPLVYKTLQEADTIGMFQVESRAQINFCPNRGRRRFTTSSSRSPSSARARSSARCSAATSPAAWAKKRSITCTRRSSRS
ncbi:MAG: hypothetical protein IPG67_14895 [Acidobacteria bacterium]|nr:hypothetical protein [Acidobacteriota bacterium]